MRAAGAADPARRGRDRAGPPAAVRHRRGPRRQLHAVHARRHGASQRARAAGRLPAQLRDRDALRAGGHADLPAVRAPARAPVLLPDPPAGQYRGERSPARRQPRPRIRPVRRARAGCGGGHRRERERRPPDDLHHARVQPRRGAADAGDPPGLPAAHERHDTAAPRGAAHPCRGRSRACADRVRDRQELRPAVHDGAPRLHPGVAEAHRGDPHCETPAARPERDRRGASREQGADGSPVRRADQLDQHARRQAADAAGPSGEGRADRLLDLLVRQLPAHAAAPQGLGLSATARTGS